MPDSPSQIVQDNKARTRRWFEEVWNQGRHETIDELLAPHAMAYGLGEAGKGLRGREYFRAFYDTFRNALSDLHVDLADIIGEGDRTAVRITLRAAHTGEGLGMPPSGAKIAVSGMVMMRWENGQIAEGWNEYDAAGMMEQIRAATGNRST